jgi:predicted nuclease with RNAse H fold
MTFLVEFASKNQPVKITPYNIPFSSCASHVARGLTLSGVPVIGFHPYLIQAQLTLRNAGVRPVQFSHFFQK